MKNTSKIKMFLKAVVVTAIALVLVLPSSAVITSSTTETKKCESRLYKTELLLLVNKELSKPGLLLKGEDICITGDNPDEDDERPKIAVDAEGKIVVTYERDSDAGTSTPLVYSEDDGASWMMAYDIDSYGFGEFGGSGVTQCVDIKYCQESDEFFWMAIDELADTPFQLMLRLPSEFPQEIEIMGMAGTNAGAYYESVVGYVGDWFLAGAIFDYPGFNPPLDRIPSIGYNDENWEQPPTLPPNSFYLDGQSILKTENAYNYEMATGANRIFIVMDHLNDTSGNHEIAYKATYADLDPDSDTYLFTPGGGPGGMDKYADIEVWPFQMYLAHNATDPDVSAKGSTVAVVYVKEGDVICSYSSDDGDTFGTSVVATDAGFPSCLVNGTGVIFCAYVQDGNISLVTSTDGGATWGTPQQINDEDGTVVEAPGTVELGAMGIVWTDSRNGANDIYFEYAELDPPIPMPKLVIKSISGGLGINAVIANEGDAPATDVEWTITVTGGILGLIDVEAPDTITSLAIGGEETVSTGIFFGLGAIDITVTASAPGANIATGEAEGTHVIIFSLVS